MLYCWKKCCSEEVNRDGQVYSGTCKHYSGVTLHLRNVTHQSPSTTLAV